MRLLITGSRNWNNARIIEKAINKHLDLYGENNGPNNYTTIIVGDNPDGADKYVTDYAQFRKFELIIEEADWDKYGKKKAGPIRNRKLLEHEPNLVLAFPHPDSKGTIDCLNAAIRMNIPVEVFYELEQIKAPQAHTKA